MELMRGIRLQYEALVGDMAPGDQRQLMLGLSHTVGRHKLKFSADKVDTMVIQAIGRFFAFVMLLEV